MQQQQQRKKNKQRRKSGSGAAAAAIPAADAPLDEILRLLRVSDSEDLLIGGYDSGIIRIWTVQSYSIVTLRGLLKKHLAAAAAAATEASSDVLALQRPADGSVAKSSESSVDSAGGFGDSFPVSFGTGAMAISPITLLREWVAHESPLLSSESRASMQCPLTAAFT